MIHTLFAWFPSSTPRLALAAWLLAIPMPVRS